MALKIEINTNEASRPVKSLNDSLDLLVGKIQEIRKAFRAVDTSKLKTAVTELDAFNKIKASNAQSESVMTLNKALTVQIEQLKKVTKARQDSASADKVVVKGAREKIQAISELEKIQKKAGEALERIILLTGKNSEVIRTHLTAIEKEKLLMNEATSAIKAKLLAEESGAKGKATLLAQSKAEIELITRLNETKARAATVSKAENKINLKKIELNKLMVAETEKLSKLEAEKAIAQARTAGSTARNIADTRKKINQLTRETEGIRLHNQAIKDAALLEAKLAHSHTTEAKRVRELTKQLEALNGTNKKVTGSNKVLSQSTKELNTSLADGNRHAAEFRAALSAMGLSFGIFTGSTIVMAAAVFGVVRSLRAAVEAGTEFEFTMDRANAVMNTTPSTANQLEEAVRSLAETTIFTAGEVSKGLVFLGMAGFDSAEALQALEPTLRLAQIGMIGMEQAADLVTNIMAGFNLQAFEVSDTVDKLSVVVTSSNTSITQLAQAMSMVGPAAANTNTSLEETTAILGFFGNVGIKATRAGTALRRGIANLSNPTEKVSKVMSSLGINIIDTNGLMRSMADIIGDLHEKGATMSNIFTIFGTRAGPAFAAAIMNGTDQIQELVKAQEDAIGVSKNLAGVLEDNAYTDFKLVISAIHETLITFYSGLDGPLRSALRGTIGLFKGLTFVLSEFSGVFKLAITAASLFGAALLLIKLGTFASEMRITTVAIGLFTGTISASTVATGIFAGGIAILQTAFAFLTGPIGLAMAAIGLITFAFTRASRESEALNESLEEQKTAMEGLNNLRSNLGLKDTDTGIKALDEMAQKFKQLEAKKGRSVGEILNEDLKEANATLDLHVETLKEKEFFLATRSGDAETVKKAKFLVDQERLRIQMIKTTIEDLKAKGEILKVNNILSLTEGEIQLEINKFKKEALKLSKELVNKKAEEATGALKLLAIERRQSALTKATQRDQKDIFESNEKSRKSEVTRLQKALSGGIGGSDSIVSELNKQMASRSKDIRSLFIKANTMEQRAEEALRAFKESDTQTEEMGSFLAQRGLSDETIKNLKKIFDKIFAMEQKNADDSLKTARILVDNKFRAQKVYQDSLTAMEKSARDSRFAEFEKDIKRDETVNKVSFDSGIRGLSEFTSTSVKLHNDLNNERMRLASEELVRLNKLKEAKEEQNRLLGEDKDQSKELNSQIKGVNSEIAKQLVLINALNLAKQDKNDIDIMNLNISKDWVLDAKTANAKLEEQLIVLGLSNKMRKSSTLALMDERIAMLVTMQATEGLTDALRDQLNELVVLRDAYELTEKKIKGLEEGWDEASNNMEGKALSAAESMQGAFTEFFIDPSKKGLDSLGDHFAMIVQRMVAEELAQKLFNGIDGKGGGLGDLFVQFFSGTKPGATNTSDDYTGDDFANWLGNNATGGSFKVGGSGGVDSELVNLRATPGEIVTISNPNGGDDARMARMGKGDEFNNVVTITVGAGVNKAEVDAAVNNGLAALEAKLVRQTQRRGKPAGVRG